MAFDTINIGAAPNDGTGDALRTGGVKINANFAKAVEGPASATAGRVAAFDGTSGKAIQGGVGDGTAAAPSVTFASDTDTGLYRPAADTLAFSTGGTERVRIDSSGNVGIGTTSPTQKLEVADVIVSGSADAGTTGQIVIRSREASAFTRSSFGTLRSSGATYFGQAVEPSVTVADGFNGGFTGTIAGGAWVIDNAGGTYFTSFPSAAMTKGSALTMQERLRITSAGNVGIGTTSPDHRLHVVDAQNFSLTAGDAQARIVGSGYSGFFALDGTSFQIGQNSAGRSLTFHSGTNMPERMRITSAGVIQFNAYGAGTLSTNASGVISASDGRYKTKTRPVEDALAAVAALQPTYFKWDEDSPFASDDEELGFIAQEVAAVIPAASPGEDEEGRFRNYNDRAIIAVLVKGMQELSAKVDELKAKLEEQNDD